MHKVRRDGAESVKPDTAQYLAKSHQALEKGRAVAGIKLAEAASTTTDFFARGLRWGRRSPTAKAQ